MIRVRGSNRTKSYSYQLRESGAAGGEANFEWSIASHLDIEASHDAADVLSFGRAVHLADRAIRRSGGAANQYRAIHIAVPVRNPDAWNAQRPQLEAMAEFATGDMWRIRFVGVRARRQRRPPNVVEADTVALFSGGLDSLCGAAKLARDGSRAVFVSHSPPGSATSQQLVRDVYDAFECTPPDVERFVSFRLEVRQKAGESGESMFPEPTRRTRPIYFLSLATAAAIATGVRTVQMSENGALALSLPNRYDTHGPAIARQAHSYILETFSRTIEAICADGKKWLIINPFADLTKGQACKLLGPAGFLAARSVSCEYSGRLRARILRWAADHPRMARRHGVGDGPQCGLCYPCIVRRAALHMAGIPDPPSAYFADAQLVLQWIRERGSATRLFGDREPPPLLNALAANPLYHERFCRDLLAMSGTQFATRYLPQLRSIPRSPNVGVEVPEGARNLMRRFAREQLEFLHDHPA